MTAATPPPGTKSGTGPGTETESELRAGLTALLQESDPHRQLDSLENVVVRAYFTKRIPEAGVVPGPADAPKTIEGWVTWAVRRSSGS
ncbi:hypothetical protein ACIGPN_08835 [Streptomyces afghaniensis]|uniref:hypothetical protein n=1 Tax=Streptomyces afghaniensis TaxID=66865 RepID=UPI0037CED4B5